MKLHFVLIAMVTVFALVVALSTLLPDQGSQAAVAGEQPAAELDAAIDLEDAPSHKIPLRNLQSSLAQIDGALRAFGQEGAEIIATSMGIARDGGVRVVIETDDPEAIRAGLLDLGLDVEAETASLLQVVAPFAALAPLAELQGVHRGFEVAGQFEVEGS